MLENRVSDEDKKQLELWMNQLKKELKSKSKNELVRLLAANIVDLYVTSKALEELKKVEEELKKDNEEVKNV